MPPPTPTGNRPPPGLRSTARIAPTNTWRLMDPPGSPPEFFFDAQFTEILECATAACRWELRKHIRIGSCKGMANFITSSHRTNYTERKNTKLCARLGN